MFKIVNLSKRYITKKKFITHALKNISLTLPDKGMCFILGKSGSGKSTFLNLLTGLDKVDYGFIETNGINISNLSQKLLDNYRNGMIGFIFQEFNLLEDMHVLDNISLSLKLQSKKVDIDLVSYFLKKVNLDDSFLYRNINELSGGQKQRIAIARALIKNPHVIVADEPTGNLDHESSRIIFDLLKELSLEKLVIIVSHDKLNAYQYGDRIIELDNGLIHSDITRKEKSTTEEEELKEGQVLTADMIKKLTQKKTFDDNNFITTDESKILRGQQKFYSHSIGLPFSFILSNALKSFQNKKPLLYFSIVLTGFFTILLSIIMGLYVIPYKYFEVPSLIKHINTLLEQSKYYPFELAEGFEKVELFLGFVTSFRFYFGFLLIPCVINFLYFNMSAKLQSKKIGILRALGSNGQNIAKIFFAEGFLFVIIQVFSIFCLSSFLLLLLKSSGYNFIFSEISIMKSSDIKSVTLSAKTLRHLKEVDWFNITGGWDINPFIAVYMYIFLPFMAFSPLVRFSFLIFVAFIYNLIISILVILPIVLRWAYKKPINIINNK
ncbi:ABC transporter ATP-binding protein [Columbia Basin potato purple top phytoplasma]|uniref:ABC transporter ATP-binding protein n=1 Tax=Columbia Basin potato purple top phytoplasma TaxID=307134 RepID=A0ABT5L8D3_9MOLU|nr:ABC transporter ATP-binding protein [Columbia Basin potato purple top phytoplasma]MDC9031918.1 ABC transporter ATP-binding protein [Columbia Basin potato purple top phytoplasma]